jgi:phosphonate transport system permease protein
MRAHQGGSYGLIVSTEDPLDPDIPQYEIRVNGHLGSRWAAWAVIVALFLWSAWATEVSLARTVDGIPFVLDFLRRMLPPDLSVLGHALRGAGQTLQIAIVGTAIAAVLALPVGFLAARNVSPPWLFYGARSVLNLFRAIDTLVYALIFVAAVGLGPFPGVLAVVAYTATVLAKLYSEAIESIDPGPVEAVAATGATRLQLLRWGVLPQLVPQFLSFTLYRFETNIRAAAILGFVGAGGIGFYIPTYLRMLNYPAASTVLLVLIVLVMVVDFASSRLRARLV